MTKPSYTEYKAEQSEAERRIMLANLLSYEQQATQHVKGLETNEASLQKQADELNARLEKSKTKTAEASANMTAYLAEINKVADQKVITNDDLLALQAKFADAKITETERKEREERTKDKSKTWQAQYDYYIRAGYAPSDAEYYTNRDVKN